MPRCSKCGAWSDGAQWNHRQFCAARYAPAPAELQEKARRAEVPTGTPAVVAAAPPPWSPQEAHGYTPPPMVICGPLTAEQEQAKRLVERIRDNWHREGSWSSDPPYRNTVDGDRSALAVNGARSYRVCWRGPDGKTQRGEPGSEVAARAVAESNTRAWPSNTRWVEHVRWCVITEDGTNARYPYDRRQEAEQWCAWLRKDPRGHSYSVGIYDEGDAPPAWQWFGERGELLMQGWGEPPREVHGLAAGCSLRVRATG